MKSHREKKQVLKHGSDQQSAQMVRQAIKDDQGLSKVAQDIQVSVKDGTVTLDGKVATEQESNLATNTASAVAVDEKIKNHIDVTNINTK